MGNTNFHPKWDRSKWDARWDMGKVMATALVAAAFALVGGILLSSVGRAQGSGVGCHVSLMAGATSTTSQASASINGTTLLDVDSLGAAGSALGAGGGCDIMIDRVVLGAFGDYAWHNASFKASSFGQSIGMDINRQYTFGARTGVMVDQSLIYVLAGWTKMSTSGLTGAVMGDFGDFTGLTLGGGIEAAVGKNVRLGVEYRHTTFDSATASLDVPGGLPVGVSAAATFKPTQDAVFARLTYSLDFFGSTASAPTKSVK